ncbi:hypothetical protein CLU79DRAFT_798306 [Phycomyces nitens]|nr:hypothetical protein CLU79DRAFT_798306 [Phycomyces nitens]
MSGIQDRVCSVCGTKRFSRTAEGGLVCRYGHQFLGWQEECDDEFGNRGFKRKTVATSVKAHHGKSRVYGVEQLSVHYRIFQFGLQKMALAIVHDLGFPSEFEYIVRELWLLYANDSKLYLTDEVDLIKESALKGQLLSAIEDDINNISDEEDSEDEHNREEYDGIGEHEEEDDYSGTKRSKGKYKAITREYMNKSRNTDPMVWPKLRFRYMLSFCYLACIWLRLPVLMNDLRRWCTTMKVPYLFLLRKIPSDILPLVDKNVLESGMLVVPSISSLSKDIYMFGLLFNRRCKLTFPLVNTPMLIYRISNQFCLPVEMYFMATHIHEKLCTFKTNSLIEEYARIENAQGNGDMIAVVSVLLAIKLTYSLDDDERDVALPEKNIVPLMPKATWFKIIKERAEKWEDVCTKKSAVSPEVELDALLNLLLNDPDDSDLGNSIKYPLKNELDRQSRQSSYKPAIMNTHDLFMNRLLDRSTEKEPVVDGTRMIGEDYQRFSFGYKAHPKMLFPKEYEVVMELAGYILGLNPTRIHSAMIIHEKVLFNICSKDTLESS